jgi:hypothetical protein
MHHIERLGARLKILQATGYKSSETEGMLGVTEVKLGKHEDKSYGGRL